MVYYHLTSHNYVDSIMKNGLIPYIGVNSKAVSEERPAIYLCKKEDIPYWKVLLGDDIDTIIEVTNGNVIDGNYTNYSLYKEWFKFSPISPLHLRVVEMDIDTSDALFRLQRDFIWLISKFCVNCAQYYTKSYRWHGDSTLHDNIEALINTICVMLPRLHYQEASQHDIKNIVMQAADDGHFTLSDRYMPSCASEEQKTKHLWEMLSEYPDDDLSKGIRNVQELIKNTFTECLFIDCGGWTD